VHKALRANWKNAMWASEGHVPLLAQESGPTPAAATLALPIQPALFRPLSKDGIGFSDETLHRVAQRAPFEDPLPVRACRRCNASVLLLKRHCSLCGLVCCFACTRDKADLSHLAFDSPARVCTVCSTLYSKRKTRDAPLPATGAEKELE
jgi:hypothetical protein